MDLPTEITSFRQLRFPGLAGELQKAGATASFVRELGDNYERYHAHLAGTLAHGLEQHGGRPDPADYPEFDSFAVAWGPLEDIIRAEGLLRRCRAFRRFGDRLDTMRGFEIPLLDDNDRLVSVE